jgi:preprotein translocase subunit SecA
VPPNANPTPADEDDIDDAGSPLDDDESELDGASSKSAAAPSGPVILAKGLGGPSQPTRLHYSAPSETGGTEERDVATAPGVPGDSGGQRRTQPRRSSKKARRRGK